MLANDDYFLLLFIKAQLEEDFNVDIAENGLEACELVKKNGKSYYKAIILDINMPIMNGIDACNNIHSFITEENLLMNMTIRKKKEKNKDDNFNSEKKYMEIFKAAA